MLVLSRMYGQSLFISDNIVVTVFKTGSRIKFGIQAPRNVRILRDNACPLPEDEVNADSSDKLEDVGTGGTMVEELTRLVISRKTGESFTIGGDVIVTLLKVFGTRVRLGIEAPRDVRIVRDDAVARDWTEDDDM